MNAHRLLEETFLLSLFAFHIFLLRESKRDPTGLTLSVNWYALNLVTAPLLGWWELHLLPWDFLPTRLTDISPWAFHPAVFAYGLCWLVGAIAIAAFFWLAESFIHLEKIDGKWRVVGNVFQNLPAPDDEVIEVKTTKASDEL